MSNVILTNIMKVRDYSCAPVSLPILASYVEHNTEADAEIFDMTLEMAKTQSYKKSLRNLEKRLDNCEVLGVHTITPNYYLVVNMLRGLKKIHGKLPTVVLGGPHATAVPVITLEQNKGLVDIVVIGPGERQLAEIVKGTPLEDIPNIAYREGRKIKLSKRKLMEPFDEKIERKFLEFCMTPTFSRRKNRVKELSDISRYSCPNQCDYCSCVRVRGGTFNRDPNIVAEEIAEINDRKKLENIIFVDDNHFLDFNHAKALNKALVEQGIEATKTSYADLDTLTKPNLQSIKKMNYHALFVGRDFVTNRLARIYGRRLAGKIRDVEGEKKILNRAARTIPLTISYIIPAPHYTMEEVRRTVDDMCDYCWQGVRYGILSPLPGTKIRDKLLKEKLLNSWAGNCDKLNGRSLDFTFRFLDKDVETWAYSNAVEEIKLSYYEKSHKGTLELLRFGKENLLIAAAITYSGDKLDSCINKFSKHWSEEQISASKDYLKVSKTYMKDKDFVSFCKKTIKNYT